MSASFTPGLALSRAFYEDVVSPLLRRDFPRLRHSAALIGSGSEVLGFDTPVSTDHAWGPRVLLFLPEEEFDRLAEPLDALLRRDLPAAFRGYPTHFIPADVPPGAWAHQRRPGHGVALWTLRAFLLDTLGFDVEAEPAPADWLTFPEQKLLALTAGAVFHDDLGLQALRDRFAYYPDDVWLYQLAAAWNRVGQEEHLVGRAGEAGDELGAAVIAARLVRDLMRLCFLMERQYAPYPKWLGTAFARLPGAPGLAPHLQAALQAATWPDRERHLCAAYEQVAARHNRLGLTGLLPTTPAPFFDRPFQVIHLHADFAGALVACIRDPALQQLAARPLLGGLDFVSDNTDLLSDPRWRPALRRLYAWGEDS